MRTIFLCISITFVCSCTSMQPGNSVEALGDEALGPGHFRVYVIDNGFADQQTVDEVFNRRARELCGGAFAPFNIRFGGREMPRRHQAGLAAGFLPLSAEVWCAGRS